MTDLDALFRAVLDRPDDDTPRLVYADELEVREASIDCPNRMCKNGRGNFWKGVGLGKYDDDMICPTCAGTGSVSNGAAARAEFIRCQVELARGMKVGARAAKRRMAELFRAICGTGPHSSGAAAFGLPRRPEGGGWVVGYSRRAADRLAGIRLDVPFAIVERGFVSEVRLTAAALCGGPCERCGGEGSLIGSPDCEHCYGEGRVTDPDSDDMDGMMDCRVCNRVDCSDCNGTGDRPGLAAALAELPLCRVVITDAEVCLEQRGGVFYWRDDVVFDHAPRLPAAICPKAEYASRADAMFALSERCLDFIKGAAITPSLTDRPRV